MSSSEAIDKREWQIFIDSGQYLRYTSVLIMLFMHGIFDKVCVPLRIYLAPA
jgi:hypothetical protein